jgi:hypothetical protein
VDNGEGGAEGTGGSAETSTEDGGKPSAEGE